MKKILCPTDFSDSAQNAIAYAAKLAHSMGAQLTLFNVQSSFENLPLEIIGTKSSKVKAYEKLLDEQSFEISRTFKISCYAEVISTTASLSKTIAFKASGYDLLVMGSNGADDFIQFFLGSHTYKAVVESNVPALVIPSDCIYSEIKEMVFAFDYLRERKLPITQLIPFVKALNARLTVLEVLEEAKSEHMDIELQELQEILKNTYGEKITLRFDTIRSATIAKSINGYIQNNQPDALAICSVHRSFLGKLFHKSVFKDLSAVLSYPVFVFHE